VAGTGDPIDDLSRVTAPPRASTERGKESRTAADDSMRITITENGPYVVTGSMPLAIQTIVPDAEGNSLDWGEGRSFDTPEEYTLCRCGHSETKPFCDSSHLRVRFDGTETASRQPYVEQAGEEEGPAVVLTDTESLCAYARFCDVGGTIWRLVRRSDPESVSMAIREGHAISLGTPRRLGSGDTRTVRTGPRDRLPALADRRGPVHGSPSWSGRTSPVRRHPSSTSDPAGLRTRPRPERRGDGTGCGFSLSQRKNRIDCVYCDS
jgi:CDGSH-type Zn-finger protein